MADQPTPPPAPPSDPPICDWLTPQRLDRLSQDLDQAVELLLQAGLLPSVLQYWVRREIAEEIASSDAWPQNEQHAELEVLEQAWRAKHDPAALGLTDQLLRRKLLVAPGCRRWARRQWQHRLETLYLDRKQQLDRASCYLLRVSDKNLALELYHQLRASEASFEELSLRHGEGPERFQGGLLPLQPLARMPLGLADVLATLSPGQLMPPRRLGKGFALVQLKSFEPTLLDTATEEGLLDLELASWIKAVVTALQSPLTSDSKELVLPP